MDVRFVGEDRDYEVVFFAWRAQSEKIDAVSACLEETLQAGARRGGGMYLGS